MTYEESVEQLESLIEAWQLDEADLNQTDINAMQTLLKESEELKKQLTTYKILHRDCKVDNLKNISKIEEMENQQKEFIEYLEDMLNDENDIFSVVRVKDVLSKYKEIIGGKNDR